MKQLWFLIVGVALLASCTNVKESEEYKALQNVNDSLSGVAGTQGVEIYDYLTDFNAIQDNLNEIKKHEQLISVNKENTENTNKRDQINEDINKIYNLLKENQEKLQALNKKYKNSNNKNHELQKLIETLNFQITEKNNEIQILNAELGQLNFEIKDLTDNLIAVQEENENQSQVIEAQTEKLNTAFYVVGTDKELKEHKIITKEGGFIGLGKNTKLDNAFDKSYFTEINTKAFDKISIFAKKAKLITTHPANSYEFAGEGKVDQLIIKDSEAFWSVSKFLVVEITN